MTTYHARVLVRVSSRAQEQGDSPEEQLRRGRECVAVIARQLGIVLVERDPLIVTQSTDLVGNEALRDLRRTNPAYEELCRQVEQGEVQFVIGRDIARVLGRTSELQAQVGTHFRNCGVQVYYYLAPNAIQHPATLDPRRRPNFNNQVTDAVGGALATFEITKLVHHRREGMNAHALAGRWRNAKPPGGYTRDILGYTANGKPVPSDIYINHDPTRGYTAEQILTAATAYTEGARVEDLGHGLYRALISPAVVGVLVYNASRRELDTRVRPDGGVSTFVTQKKHVQWARMADIASAFLRGVDARSPHELTLNLIVTWGNWEPIFKTDAEIALWQQVQTVRGGRDKTGGRQAHPHPLSGLLRCAYCGSDMILAKRYFYKRKGYWVSTYDCKAHLDYQRYAIGAGCRANTAHEDEVIHTVIETLEAYVSDSDKLRDHFTLPSPPSFEAEREKWLRVREKAEKAIGVWDGELEAGTVNRSTYWQKVEKHQALVQEATTRLAALNPTPRPPVAEQMEAVTRLVRNLRYWLSHDPRRLEAALRYVVKEVVVQDRAVVRLALGI